MSLFGTDQVWRVYTSHFWSVILWIFVDICGLFIVGFWVYPLPHYLWSVFPTSNPGCQYGLSAIFSMTWPEFYLRYLPEKGTLPWDSGRLYRFKRWAQLKAVCCMNKRHILFGICLLFATSKLFINTNLHSVKHHVLFNTSLNYPKIPVSINKPSKTCPQKMTRNWNTPGHSKPLQPPTATQPQGVQRIRQHLRVQLKGLRILRHGARVSPDARSSWKDAAEKVADGQWLIYIYIRIYWYILYVYIGIYFCLFECYYMAILVSVLVEEKDRKLPQVDRLIATFLGSDHLGMEAPKPKNFPVENRFKKWVRLLDQILNWEIEKNFRDQGAKKLSPTFWTSEIKSKIGHAPRKSIM